MIFCSSLISLNFKRLMKFVIGNFTYIAIKIFPLALYFGFAPDHDHVVYKHSAILVLVIRRLVLL